MTETTRFDVPTENVGRDVATSAIAQVVARGVHVACAAIVLFAVLRYLGPERYGDYVLIITILGVATILTELDLPNLATREIAHDPHAAERVIGTITVIRIGLALAAAAVMQVVLLAFSVSPGVHLGAAAASLALVGEAFLSVVVAYRVQLKHQHEAVVRLVGKLVELVAVVAVIAAGLWIPWLFLAAPLGVSVAAVLAWTWARHTHRLRLVFDRHRARSLMLAALVVGPAALIGVLYLKVDALMIGLLLDPRALGTYGAAFQPIEYLFLLTGILSLVLFPLLARFHVAARARFAALYQRGALLLLTPVLLVPVFAVALGGALIEAIDPRYGDAAVSLALLACALPLLALNSWQSFTLLAANHQRVTLRYLAWCTAAKAVLAIPLILWLGIDGAALGTLLTSVALVVWSTGACAHHCDVRLDYARTFRLLVVALAVAVLLAALARSDVPLLVNATVGAVAYVAAVLLTRTITVQDLRGLAGAEAEVTLDLTVGDGP